MTDFIKITANDVSAYPDTQYLGLFNPEQARIVTAYHKSFPEYAQTPLVALDSLAEKTGIGKLFVKDESFRFGLNAFKVLGGSYAIADFVARKLGRDISEITCPFLTSLDAKKALGDMTFITATDGNHGRGVAWTANRIGQRSIVYMPRGTARERLENIRKLGSDADILDLDYDSCVRLAGKTARENGYALIQDTVFGEFTRTPLYVMQGYMTMALEAVKGLGGVKPTHVFLQAGVGSMAAAVAGYLSAFYGKDKPVIVIVEPHSANCLYLTAKAADGKLHACETEMNSMMAGLNCGEVCPPAWEILRKTAEFFITIPDESAARGMRALAHPGGSDIRIVSGESGASTAGALSDIMTNPLCGDVRKQIGLDENSVVLLFSTEGDTDRENYRRITE